MTFADPTLAREAESAIAWWRMAGVDCAFTDDATAWWAEPPAPTPQDAAGDADQNRAATSHEVQDARPSVAARGASTRPPATLRRDLLGESPPADLAAFRQWWLEAPELGATRLHPRVPPRGPAGAVLMVLVADPEEQDRDRLLSGPRGRLLAKILAAMGLGEEDAYVASALPSHTPMADLAALAAGGLDAVLAHHLKLAAPRRLVAFGTSLAPMIGVDGPAAAGAAITIGQDRGALPVLVSEELESMMSMPRLKARFWRRWMECTAS